MSHRNHHHQTRPDDSPPPKVGTTRPRPPDTPSTPSRTLPASNPETIKSPHTNRIVKKPRNGTPMQKSNPDNEADAIFAPMPSTTTPMSPTDFNARLSTTNKAVEPSESTAIHLEHLETLVDSALATITIITSHGAADAAPNYSDHLKAAIHALLTKIDPKHDTNTATSPTPANTTSYVQATLHPPTRPKAKVRFDPPPTMTPRKSSIAQVAHKDSTARATNTIHTTNPQRFLVRWPAGKSPAILENCPAGLEAGRRARISTSAITKRFNTHLTKRLHPDGNSCKDCIAGVEWTRAGNLIVHAQPPYTAMQLVRECTADIITLANMNMTSVPTPVVELDSPWTGVVIHNVESLALYKAGGISGEAFWRDVHDHSGLCQGAIKDVRVLCSPSVEYQTRDRVSLRIMLEDPNVAMRLLRDGMFIFGGYCRASRYRPRRRTATHRSSLQL
ncbi:hypothetical protein ARMSODRAFT_595778 [Armillaria solidipes]|uniref:Uncharacterized protein n=1 Tax=Armillaria solidipes TaxID=1076256 RepID=A0A2H3C875_9AGAR|nr:hypothetical protein ARMSODRAFT_595778 [Armillaria solidipes]